MALRLITYITLFAFLNGSLGCTKMAVRPADEIVKHPAERIHALALQSSYPFKINLNDVAEVRFSGTRMTLKSESTVDTVSAVTFEEEAPRYKEIKIESIKLKSGEDINLKDRKSRYEAWAGVINVLGSEIIFDEAGGLLDTTDDFIRGETLKGDTVAVHVDDIAYIRREVTDFTQSFFFVGGLVLTFLALFVGVSSLSSSSDE